MQVQHPGIFDDSMQILSNILAFLFAAGIVIFVHELGHYLVGKAFGVRVLVFSLGFGQRIWGFRRGDTDYRVSLIPLGGYVSFDGQDPRDQTRDPEAFANHPRWQRIAIYLAGPVMNVILAILLLAVVYMWGTDLPSQRDVSTEIGQVGQGSAAEAAGLLPGDRFIRIDGEEVNDWQAVSMAFLTSPEQPVDVVYLRDGQEYETVVTPTPIPKYELGDAGLRPAAPARVAGVMRDTPADRAGLRFGDALLAVDGRGVGSVQDFQELVGPRAGQTLVLEVERGERRFEVNVVPQANEEGRGVVGIFIDQFHFKRFGPREAIARSAADNWDMTVQIFAFIGKIFERKISPQSAIGGPIEIAKISGAAARRGFRDLLFFMSMISLNLGILNMMPIPILDGGQISILAVESVLRRDLSIQLKERIIQVGLVAIVLLMVMALYFDLLKSWPGTG